MAVIALDLGGTKLAGAIFARDGRMICHTLAALEGRQGRAVGELVCLQALELLAVARAKRISIEAVGVSVPGISDAKTGKVWAPNIPGWDAYPLRRELDRATGNKRLRVVIDNDRACSILGETWRGAAKGCRNAIFLAVGTGIGAGILVDGRIVRGAHGSAGAIGWLALDRPFRPEYTACGCFEHHASGNGLAKIARGMRVPRLGDPPSSGGELTAHDVFAAYARGDKVARAVLAQAVEFWGMAVANLVSLFNPEKILFGGGVFGPAGQFIEDIAAEAQKWAQPIAMRRVKLHRSRLGSAAALYGAGWLALTAKSGRTVWSSPDLNLSLPRSGSDHL